MSRGRAPLAPAAWLAAALALLLALAPRAWADPTFPPLTGRVVDDAHVLTPQAAADLTSKLAALEQSTGRQLVVATVPSLQGAEIEDYGVGLIRAWKLGDKATNTGAILLVAPAEKKVRVEVGYGLEGVLTDALSEITIQRAILPKFRAGDVSGGIVDGADSLIAQLQLPPDQARAQVQAATTEREQAQSRSARRDPAGMIFGLIFLFWLVSMAWRFLTGHRGRSYGGRGGGGGGGLGWILPMMLLNGLGGGRDEEGGGDFGGGGGFGGGGDGGGFSGDGGSGGGGGASGSW